MGKQTIRIRRVGSITFGMVLVTTGILFLTETFLPNLDYRFVFRFWPIILILLGIEVLMSTRQKSWEILDLTGKVVEQNKVIYDVPAIVLTMFLVGFSLVMGVVNWAVYHSGGTWVF